MRARHHSRHRNDLSSMVHRLGDRVEELGFKCLPSARLVVKDHVARGIAKGKIHDADEARLVAAALLSGAVDRAKEAHVREIGAREIKAGWAEKISVRGWCPPIQCMTRSILDRRDELGRDIRSFNLVCGDSDD